MAEDNEAASKTEEPTPRKLEEARRKGDVARSQDVGQLASLLGAFGVMAVRSAFDFSINLNNSGSVFNPGILMDSIADPPVVL